MYTFQSKDWAKLLSKKTRPIYSTLPKEQAPLPCVWPGGFPELCTTHSPGSPKTWSPSVSCHDWSWIQAVSVLSSYHTLVSLMGEKIYSPKIPLWQCFILLALSLLLSHRFSLLILSGLNQKAFHRHSQIILNKIRIFFPNTSWPPQTSSHKLLLLWYKELIVCPFFFKGNHDIP